MKFSTKDMILVSLFSALTVVGTFIRIPMQPVAFTLQTVFVMYSGLLLGGRRALASQVVYVILGLMGAPVFANGAGGPGYVLTPSFGYLLGFMLAAYAIGRLGEKVKVLTTMKAAGILLIGTGLIYLAGLPYLHFIVSFVMGKDIGIAGVLASGLTPFIFPDIIKLTVVAATSPHILRLLKKTGVFKG
ncbi:MAG TPA: biotin transporter BioY [Clostridia bacterium]|nr:biotin transporter BioY [Clostridia bacterium]